MSDHATLLAAHAEQDTQDRAASVTRGPGGVLVCDYQKYLALRQARLLSSDAHQRRINEAAVSSTFDWDEAAAIEKLLSSKTTT